MGKGIFVTGTGTDVGKTEFQMEERALLHRIDYKKDKRERDDSRLF